MAMIDKAEISVTRDGGNVTITGGGSLTFVNAMEFGRQLKEASLNAESVAVDLRPAVFIDTQIVQDLGKAAVALLKRDKRLKVAVVDTAYPLRLLKISGFEEIMDIEEGPAAGQ
jgi:anti-anti-sigma regulatory factor